MEVVLTTCQYLMAVSLMAHIPHNAVVGGVEHVVQGYGKLNHSERRCKVAWVLGKFLHDVAAQFGAQLGQLTYVQTTQVAWILYIV